MKRGFTLIEVIIVMALFSVLVGSACWVFTVGLSVWSSGRGRSEIRQDSSIAMETMVRELSQASSFTIAQAGTVKFSADVDDDGADETITFNTSGNNLNRTVEDIAVVLARNVDTFQLAYYDLNNNLLEQPLLGLQRDDIRVITISLTLSEADETFSLSSGVYARNQ